MIVRACGNDKWIVSRGFLWVRAPREDGYFPSTVKANSTLPGMPFCT